MSPVDSNIDAMQYIVIFLLLFFGIISCNSYAHLEDATQECSRRVYAVLLVAMYAFPHI
jgi:hypothetical protein